MKRKSSDIEGLASSIPQFSLIMRFPEIMTVTGSSIILVFLILNTRLVTFRIKFRRQNATGSENTLHDRGSALLRPVRRCGGRTPLLHVVLFRNLIPSAREVSTSNSAVSRMFVRVPGTDLRTRQLREEVW